MSGSVGVLRSCRVSSAKAPRVCGLPVDPQSARSDPSRSRRVETRRSEKDPSHPIGPGPGLSFLHPIGPVQGLCFLLHVLRPPFFRRLKIRIRGKVCSYVECVDLGFRSRPFTFRGEVVHLDVSVYTLQYTYWASDSSSFPPLSFR